jgi:hypothetical protein
MMELVEDRNQSPELDFVAHIDVVFPYTSAQQNPRGVLELPFYLLPIP